MNYSKVLCSVLLETVGMYLLRFRSVALMLKLQNSAQFLQFLLL